MKNLIAGCLLFAVSLGAQQPAMIVSNKEPATVYQQVLIQLQKEGFNVESASRDAGIQTSLVVVKGGYHQTGSYTKISFIDEGGKTSLRVAVFEVKRYKALKAEPWGEPKVNTKESQAQAFRLEKDLGW
jgi:hypothetical protein